MNNSIPIPSKSQRGLAVVMLALLLREEPGEPRDLALISLLDHLQNLGLDIQPAHLYLTAKALRERSDLDMSVFEVEVQPLMAECQALLQEYYPQFRDSPTTQQLLGVLAELNRLTQEPNYSASASGSSGSSGSAPGQPRELEARDVFGIADSPANQRPANQEEN